MSKSFIIDVTDIAMDKKEIINKIKEKAYPKGTIITNIIKLTDSVAEELEVGKTIKQTIYNDIIVDVEITKSNYRKVDYMIYVYNLDAIVV